MNQLRNARWMKERGHRVVLLGLKDSRIVQEAESAGIAVSYVEQHKKYYDFKRAIQLKRQIRNKSITHLILRDPKDISLGVTTKKLLRGKLFLAYFMEMQLGVQKSDFIHTWRFKGLDLWSCPLDFLAQQVKTMTRFPEDRIKVIPSAMDLSKFDAVPSQVEARKKLELPQDKVILGLVGRFDPFKGHQLLLDAFTLLPDALQNKVALAFLGEPTVPDVDNFYGELMQRIEKDPFDSRVHILPFRKDVETFYAAIDCFVMASKAETFGMVTIESMAAGTPVIGSNAGGTPELLENGERGILFETMNKTALAEAVIYFIKEYELDAEKLRSSVSKYSHLAVCQQVENHLKLSG